MFDNETKVSKYLKFCLRFGFDFYFNLVIRRKMSLRLIGSKGQIRLTVKHYIFSDLVVDFAYNEHNK